MGSMIKKELIPKLFDGAYNEYKGQVDHEDFSLFVAKDIVDLFWELDQKLSTSIEALNGFHEIQGDMIDSLTFFIKQDPTRLEGEAQIFTNKLNKFLMEVEL